MNKLLMLIILIVCLIIYLVIITLSKLLRDTFKVNNINKDVIIFSAGPTLNEIKNYLHIFTPEFYKKYYIIGLKDAAIYLDKNGIKVDYFLYSHAGYKKKYDSYKFKNSKNVKKFCNLVYSNNIFINFFYKIYNFFTNKKCIKSYVNIDNLNKNMMKCIMDDKPNCITYNKIKGKKVINDGHIILDMGIIKSIELKCKNIYCLGWDICGNHTHHYSYFNKDKFENENNNIFKTKEDIFKFENIREFSKHLPGYLKKHYNVNIYKLSDKQCVYLPLYDINKL